MSCTCDLSAAAVHRWDCGMDPLEAEREKTAHLAQALARAVRRIGELEDRIAELTTANDAEGLSLWPT